MEAARDMRSQWDFVIAGLGRTGLACLDYLAAAGRRVAVTDSRAAPPGLEQARRRWPELTLRLGALDRSLLLAAREVVVSPGLSLEEPALAEAAGAGVPLVSEIELFARAAPAPVAAITGSNGKSTVTTMLAEMARAAGRSALEGGNLGTPALELLARPVPDLYVLELSSFQLESTRSLHSAAATVLNVSADHMDRYPSLDAYAAAKARILDGAAVAVLNRDDPRVRAMAPAGASCLWFGAAAPGDDSQFGIAGRSGEPWLMQGGRPLLAAGRLPLPGAHNRLNALAALALGTALGLPRESMVTALEGFRGLPHRTEVVAEHSGVLWINDSKATNVGAAVAALAGMDRPVVLIAGGDGKGADFTALGRAMAQGTRAVVVMGADAGAVAAVVPADVPVRQAGDMNEAVTLAGGLARPGDVVLLSPACASLDMYRNFEARGDAFRAAVGELARG